MVVESGGIWYKLGVSFWARGLSPLLIHPYFPNFSKKSYPHFTPRSTKNQLFINMEMLKTILKTNYSGIQNQGENMLRVEYGDSYLLFQYTEFTGVIKPIKQRILILKDSNVDDILEILSTKIPISPDDLGPIKNEINVHARGKLNEYLDIQK